MASDGPQGCPEVHTHFHFPADPRIEEILATLRRIDRREKELMATFREMLRDAMGQLVEEVRQTRSAADAVGVAIAGLREQLVNAVDQNDVAAVQAVIAGLDDVQAQLSAAAGENVDGPAPAPAPAPGPAPDPNAPQPDPNAPPATAGRVTAPQGTDQQAVAQNDQNAPGNAQAAASDQHARAVAAAQERAGQAPQPGQPSQMQQAATGPAQDNQQQAAASPNQVQQAQPQGDQAQGQQPQPGQPAPQGG